jgi:hypothetical protein
MYPETLLIDASGNLYAGGCNPNCERSLVVEYGPKGNGTLRAIKSDIQNPQALALDTNGNLYVGGGQFGDHKALCQVPIFAPGAIKPTQTITDGVRVVGSVLLDSANNVYVLNEGHGRGRSCGGPSAGSVTVYPAGGLMYSEQIQQSIHDPISMILGV